MGEAAPTNEPDGRQARSGFFTPPPAKPARPVVDVRGLFHAHLMRDRTETFMRYLEVLALAHWLVTEISEVLQLV